MRKAARNSLRLLGYGMSLPAAPRADHQRQCQTQEQKQQQGLRYLLSLVVARRFLAVEFLAFLPAESRAFPLVESLALLPLFLLPVLLLQRE